MTCLLVVLLIAIVVVLANLAVLLGGFLSWVLIIGTAGALLWWIVATIVTAVRI
jgi:hypothetical protein